MKRYCKLYNELHTSPSRVQYKQKDFQLVSYNKHFYPVSLSARLAQSVEHQTFNLRVAGSSPSSGGGRFKRTAPRNACRVSPDIMNG